VPSQERGWIVTPERMVRRRCAGGRVEGCGRSRTVVLTLALVVWVRKGKKGNWYHLMAPYDRDPVLPAWREQRLSLRGTFLSSSFCSFKAK